MINDKIKQDKIRSLVNVIGNDIMNIICDLKVTNIMLNSDGKLWIQNLGSKEYIQDISNIHATSILQKIADLNDTIINDKHARLATQIELPINEFETRKIRVQGFVPPVTNNASFTFRLHSNEIYSLDDYIKNNSLTNEQKNIIDNAIVNNKNIIIAGAGSAGKTTFANALLLRLNDLVANDRLLILQDTQELNSSLLNTEYLTSNVNVSLNDLVMDTLRSTADRIIIGELRSGAVALEWLKMCNTGHNGSIATIHTDSVEDTIDRFAELLLEVTQSNLMNMIRRNVHVIVYLQDKKVIDIFGV
jgi:type IV secretion system protein TrbB